MAAVETSRLQTRSGLIEYALSGQGRPAVVLFNGAGVTLDGWRALYPGIDELAATLAWNRFGLPGSDVPRALQSGARVTAALRELLGYAALEPPYVLVGHSIGGLYANLFARLHPADVAGALMLEATHPGDEEVLGADASRAIRSLSKVLALPPELLRDNLRSELDAAHHVAMEIKAAGPFPSVPLTVITGAVPPPQWLMSEEAARARQAHQCELAHLSPRSEHVIAQQSGHFPQLSEPGVVLAALQRLIGRSAIS